MDFNEFCANAEQLVENSIVDDKMYQEANKLVNKVLSKEESEDILVDTIRRTFTVYRSGVRRSASPKLVIRPWSDSSTSEKQPSLKLAKYVKNNGKEFKLEEGSKVYKIGDYYYMVNIYPDLGEASLYMFSKNIRRYFEK